MLTSVTIRYWWTQGLRIVALPYDRFRHAQLLHSMRVGLAVLASILLTSGIHFPHGIWASISVLLIIGGQRSTFRTVERSLGTALGAVIGLLVLIQLDLIGSLSLTYLLMSVAAAICGYYAIRQRAYAALLTAMTMCIVAGHGGNSIDTGLWRALSIFIGIAVSLVFSFVLPLQAVYVWRYQFAHNLRICAHTYRRIAMGKPLEANEHTAVFGALGDRFFKLRLLAPAVTREVGLLPGLSERMQQLHRSLLSSLELMATTAFELQNTYERHAFIHQCEVQAQAACDVLLAMARALRFGSPASLGRLAYEAPSMAALRALAEPAHAQLQGPYWLGQQLAERLEQMRVLLLESEPGWNIEPRLNKHSQSALIRSER